MKEFANEFEDYQVEVKKEDPFKVKHISSEYFEYFDELTKGSGPGGVYYILNQDEDLKHLVFDLLFQRKFKNFALIRELKHYNYDVQQTLHLS